MLEDVASGKNSLIEGGWDPLDAATNELNLTLPSSHKIPALERPKTEGKAKHQVNMNMTGT